MSYITEEQQVEELKNWWKENSKVIIATFILVIASVLGWRYWQNYQITSNMNTSNNYEQVMQAYEQNPQLNQGVLQQFVEENNNSSYAVFALFNHAKSAVDQNDLKQAESSLQQAFNISLDNNLRSIAALRLAELQIQQQKYDEAQATLTEITDNAWQASKQQLLGDILLAKGDTVAAKATYQQVLANNHLNALDKQLLQLKVDSLSQ